MRRNQMVPLVLLFCAVAVSAQRPSPADERVSLVQRIDARREHYATVAKEIWGFAEEHRRRQGDDGRGEDHGADDRRSLHRSGAHPESES